MFGNATNTNSLSIIYFSHRNIYICPVFKCLVMKKYYIAVPSILLLMLASFSCSNDDTKTTNEVASRPTVPITTSEVMIGTQVWMKKNLNVSRYRNGDLIPQVTNATQWENLTTGAWCYYENNTANGTVYGKLYNWYAVNDPRGLAPTGYHVPTDGEWTSLTTFLGGVDIAGDKMKATTSWNPFPLIFNSNSSGFTALSGGYRSPNGTFTNIGYFNCYWSSSQSDGINVWNYFLKYNSSWVDRLSNRPSAGFSVRCIKD